MWGEFGCKTTLIPVALYEESFSVPGIFPIIASLNFPETEEILTPPFSIN